MSGVARQIMGNDPSTGNEEIMTVKKNNDGTIGLHSNVSFEDKHLDVFGKLITASPFKIFEYSASQPLDLTRYWSKLENAGGTVTRNATTIQVELYTTTASGDKAIAQTRRSIQYNKGNAQEILTIFRSNPVANRRERWGYFDDNNGVFFEHDGTSARVVIRSNTSGSPVDTQHEQADWDDPLDGTGPSGLTIDWTKQTVYKIDFGWLSARGVRFFIDVQGELVLVKKWYISNALSVPFMKTGNLPIRFEVENTGTVASSEKSYFTCCAVLSSGGKEQEGSIRSVSTQTSLLSITTSDLVIAGVRLNSNYLNGSLQPLNFNFLPASGTDVVYYKAVYNPNLTNTSWTTPSSGIADFLNFATATGYTGGSIIAQGHIPLSNKNVASTSELRDLLNDIYCGRDITNTADPLVMVVRTIAGSGSLAFTGAFKEYS